MARRTTNSIPPPAPPRPAPPGACTAEQWALPYGALTVAVRRHTDQRASETSRRVEYAGAPALDLGEVQVAQRPKNLKFHHISRPSSIVRKQVRAPLAADADAIQATASARGAMQAHITEEWRRRRISNFDYLMYLNTVAGR